MVDFENLLLSLKSCLLVLMHLAEIIPVKCICSQKLSEMGLKRIVFCSLLFWCRVAAEVNWSSLGEVEARGHKGFESYS